MQILTDLVFNIDSSDPKNHSRYCQAGIMSTSPSAE